MPAMAVASEQQQPSEKELRQYVEQLREARVADLLGQAFPTRLIGAMRCALAGFDSSSRQRSSLPLH